MQQWALTGLKGATLWAGKRYHKNPDIHMLDYTYRSPAQSPGWGLDNVDVGIGKLSTPGCALARPTGPRKNVGQYQPGIVERGARAATSHDLRLQDIAVNPGGKLTVGASGLVVGDNRDDAALADGGSDGGTASGSPPPIRGRTCSVWAASTR